MPRAGTGSHLLRVKNPGTEAQEAGTEEKKRRKRRKRREGQFFGAGGFFNVFF